MILYPYGTRGRVNFTVTGEEFGRSIYHTTQMQAAAPAEISIRELALEIRRRWPSHHMRYVRFNGHVCAIYPVEPHVRCEPVPFFPLGNRLDRNKFSFRAGEFIPCESRRVCDLCPLDGEVYGFIGLPSGGLSYGSIIINRHVADSLAAGTN